MKLFLGTALCACTAIGHAGSLDTRLSYDSVSQDYTGRIHVSHTWPSGFGGSLEAPFALTGAKYSDDVDVLRTGTTEVVGYYTKRFSPSWFIRPGLGVQVSSSGSTLRPLLTAGYKINPQLDTSMRLRFGKRNYETTNLAKQPDRDFYGSLTWWFGYKVSKSLVLEYQAEYIQKVNNQYRNDNGKLRIVEQEFTVLFPDALGKGVTPYALIGHLGTSFSTYNKVERDHWRPRAGIKIAF